MSLQINNQTAGIFEFYRSRIFFGNCDWQEVCFTTGLIKKETTKNFIFSIYNVDKTPQSYFLRRLTAPTG